MELRHLRYFIKLAELLHFTEAAGALKVSQPNLSLQIQQLEDELGSRLFERVGRAVHLTAAGHLFLTYAQAALRELEAGQRGIHDLDSLLRGTLQIGVTNSFTAEVFPGMLAGFLRAHPAIQVVATMGTDRCIQAGVREAKLDLGLVSQTSKPADFSSMPLFKQDLVVVVSRSHRLAGSAALRMRDLEQVALALPSSEVSVRQLIDSALASARIESQLIVETDDIDVLLGLASHGVAATIVTSQAAARLSARNVSRIPLREKGLSLTAAFIWPLVADNSRPAARFLELASGCKYPGRLRRARN